MIKLIGIGIAFLGVICLLILDQCEIRNIEYLSFSDDMPYTFELLDSIDENKQKSDYLKRNIVLEINNGYRNKYVQHVNISDPSVIKYADFDLMTKGEKKFLVEFESQKAALTYYVWDKIVEVKTYEELKKFSKNGNIVISEDIIIPKGEIVSLLMGTTLSINKGKELLVEGILFCPGSLNLTGEIKGLKQRVIIKKPVFFNGEIIYVEKNDR